MKQTAGKDQEFLKPSQHVSIPPVQPRPTPPVAPAMDDSPFGFTTAHQPQGHGPMAKSEDQLSRDAFEAGKDIYQTFTEPPAAPALHISPAQQKDIARTAGLGAGQSEYIMETPAAIPPRAPMGQIPVKGEASLPDFSDALSDVSMAFNAMMQKPESGQNIPPMFNESLPPQPNIAPDSAAPGQGDMGIQPEMGNAGEMMIDPETMEKENTDGSELNFMGSGLETIEGEPDFNQFSISSLEEEQQMPIEKPETPIVQSSAGAKPRSFESGRDEANPSQEVLPSTEIDVLAEKVASKIVRKISTEAIREIAWEIVPGIIEKVLRE
jgi:hypothetical protein